MQSISITSRSPLRISKWNHMHLICGNIQNWLLILNLIYKTLFWGRKWLVDFNAGKNQLVLFDRSNKTGAIDVKMNGSVLGEKPSCKVLGLTFSSNLDWGFLIISIAKTASKKIGTLIHSIKFLSPRLLYIVVEQNDLFAIFKPLSGPSYSQKMQINKKTTMMFQVNSQASLY